MTHQWFLLGNALDGRSGGVMKGGIVTQHTTLNELNITI